MGIFGNRKAGKEPGTQHKDPVCGMLVAEAEAVGPDTIQEEVYWFCSGSCQDTFRERKGMRRGRKQEVAP